MSRSKQGIFLILISILLVIIAFVADHANIAVSDIFVMFYWIIVLIILVYGLYLLFFKENGKSKSITN